MSEGALGASPAPLVRRWRRYGSRMLAGLGARPDEIDDVLGDVAERLARADARGERVRSPKDYFRTVVRRAWADHCSRQARIRRDGGSLDPERHRKAGNRFLDRRGRLVDAPILGDRERDHLEDDRDELLTRLPPRLRSIALLLAEGYSAAEIGQLAGLTRRRIQQIAHEAEIGPAPPSTRREAVTFATRRNPPSRLTARCKSRWFRQHPGRRHETEEAAERFEVRHVSADRQEDGGT